MHLKTDFDKMTIFAQYDSKTEFKKKAMQKRMRMAFKILEKGGKLKAEIDDSELTVRIECYDLEIYQQVLKGFQSVAHISQ